MPHRPAIITPALIAGAFAERIKFSASILFFFLWHLIVYAPICHQVWGGGWMGGLGVLDFAGGAVVHVNAGVAGLVAGLVLGPRHGHGRDNMAPHNLAFTAIGAGPIVALAARRCDPGFRTFADRLAAAGKQPRKILVAIMRKLIEAANLVIKRDQPWQAMPTDMVASPNGRRESKLPPPPWPSSA